MDSSRQPDHMPFHLAVDQTVEADDRLAVVGPLIQILTACSDDWITSLSIAEITSAGLHGPGQRTVGVDTRLRQPRASSRECRIAARAGNLTWQLEPQREARRRRWVDWDGAIRPDGSIGGSADAEVNCCECAFAFVDGYLERELTPVAPDDDLCGLSNRRPSRPC